jgi:hypothetical protein
LHCGSSGNLSRTCHRLSYPEAGRAIFCDGNDRI